MALGMSCNGKNNKSYKYSVPPWAGLQGTKSKAQRRRRMFTAERLQGVEPPIRKIFIDRVMSYGNSKSVQAYLSDRNIEVKDIVQVSHNDSKYKSFKISIYQHDLSTVLNEYFWPRGVYCRSWKEKNVNNSFKTNQFFNSNYSKAHKSDNRNFISN